MPSAASPAVRVEGLEHELSRLADPERAALMERFFKCGPGEYGEGDRFLGLTVPQLRALAKQYRQLSLPDLQRLLDAPWHEHRFVALVIVVLQYQREHSPAGRSALYRFYLRNLDRINNWDLVDVSCGPVVGGHLLHRRRDPLYRMAKSRHLWTRRVAIVSTGRFILNGEARDTLRIAELLLRDRHDLIHKATGWMLREVGKRVDRAALEGFLDRHAAQMPRTMLRYALEHFPEPRRRHYLGLRAARAEAVP